MASDALSRYIEAAAGVTQVTKARAEQIVKQLTKQTQAISGPASGLVEDLLERSRENREALSALVRTETDRAIKAMGLATRGDVDRLQRQVADLKRRLSESDTAAKKTAKKTTAKRSTSTAKPSE